jgi:hypothetical protein
MKNLAEEHTLLAESTEDILVSVLKETGMKGVSEKDLRNSKAYVIIHQDNPDTNEILGSVNISVPIHIDKKSKEAINAMNIPTERPMLTCFGLFDASNEMKDFTFRCVIRNEHGYPISHATEGLLSRTNEMNEKITSVIQKEVLEDINKIM